MCSRWRTVMARRSSPAHSGTGAGASTSRRPFRTAIPTSAWVTLLPVDHEISVVSGPVSGPYVSWTTWPSWTTTSARVMLGTSLMPYLPRRARAHASPGAWHTRAPAISGEDEVHDVAVRKPGHRAEPEVGHGRLRRPRRQGVGPAVGEVGRARHHLERTAAQLPRAVHLAVLLVAVHHGRRGRGGVPLEVEGHRRRHAEGPAQRVGRVVQRDRVR